MQKIYFLTLLFLTFNMLSAQEKLTKEEKARRQQNIEAANPFAKYGSKAKVATLSKGKYLEVHDLDSIVTIGSIRFNVNLGQIVDVLEQKNFNADSQPLGDVPSRWMSIDPLSEEFSSWSPYNFSFNSPLKFNDPTGMGPEDVIITGALKDKAFEQLKASSQNLNLSMNSDGKVTATAKEGATLTAAEKTLQSATTDTSVTVNLNATASNFNPDGSVMIGGQFGGSTVNADGTVTANQTVNPNQMEIIDGFTKRGEGVGTLHETLEAYSGAKNSPGASPAVADKPNAAYDAAHKDARATDPRHREVPGVSPLNDPRFVTRNSNGTYNIQVYIGTQSNNKLLFSEKNVKKP